MAVQLSENIEDIQFIRYTCSTANILSANHIAATQSIEASRHHQNKSADVQTKQQNGEEKFI